MAPVKMIIKIQYCKHSDRVRLRASATV